MSNIKKIQIGENIYDLDAKSVDGHQVEQTGIASDTTTIPTTAQVKAYVDSHSGSSGYSKSETDTLLNGKQPTLISGTNIKTINGQSILGSGDLSTDEVGHIELSSTSGTLTDAQYAEALKPYCIIKQTISEGYHSYFIKLYEAPNAINFEYITKGYTNNHFAILRKYCQISKTNKSYNIYNDNLALYSASEADEAFKLDFVNAEYNKTLNLWKYNSSWENGSSKDTKTYFNMYISFNDQSSVSYHTDYNSTGRKTATFTTPNTVNNITIKHNGSQYDLDIIYVDNDGWLQPNTTYTLSFDLNGYNPSVNNGLLLSNIMLNEGSTALPYVEYGGGRIAHINEARLLWKNGSPNSSFSAQTINTLDMSKYTYIIVGYKTDSSSGQVIQYHKVKYSKGNIFQISTMISGGYFSYSREFRFDSTYSTQIYIYPGYEKNDTYNNSNIIPVAIYGTNVL